MSKKDKLLKRFLTRPADFSWEELIKLLNGFGYELANSGKTGGSRRRFVHPVKGFITLHEPHPIKVLKRYQINQIIECLTEEELI